MTTEINHHAAMRLDAMIAATRQHLADLLRLRNEIATADTPVLEVAISATDTIGAVARALGSTYKDVVSGERYAGAIRARQAAVLTLRRLGLTYSAIGKALRSQNHTTIRENEGKALAREQAEPTFARVVAAGVARGLRRGQQTELPRAIEVAS